MLELNDYVKRVKGRNKRKKKKNSRFYLKNKDKILEARKGQRRKKRPRIAVEEQSGQSGLPKPDWRLYKARHRARERKEKEKASSKSVIVSANAVQGEFSNRTRRKRAVDGTKNNLPCGPRRKVAVVASLIESSTTPQSLQGLGYVNSPENQEPPTFLSSACDTM